ncbi:hypothetical protein [Gracilimonas tropica]|uniref:hypothetical protein n=1 Tax=Gracilimonas tropica TaxID=454600 RepID=UPI00035C618F|nr:hypothetical protein [Gracilimonas tropica]
MGALLGQQNTGTQDLGSVFEVPDMQLTPEINEPDTNLESENPRNIGRANSDTVLQRNREIERLKNEAREKANRRIKKTFKQGPAVQVPEPKIIKEPVKTDSETNQQESSAALVIPGSANQVIGMLKSIPKKYYAIGGGLLLTGILLKRGRK